MDVAAGKTTLADAWSVRSSRRFKEHITPLSNALEKVLRLRGVAFDYKATQQHSLGMIAEEVGEVVPEAVAYEANGTDAVSVDYGRLTALLVEAVKEQQAQIRALQAELKAIKAQLPSDRPITAQR